MAVHGYVRLLGTAYHTQHGEIIAGVILHPISETAFKILHSATGGEAQALDAASASGAIASAIRSGVALLDDHADQMERHNISIKGMVADSKAVAASPADLLEDRQLLQGYLDTCERALATPLPEDPGIVAADAAVKAQASGALNYLDTATLTDAINKYREYHLKLASARAAIEAARETIRQALDELLSSGADKLAKVKISQKLRRVGPEVAVALEQQVATINAALAIVTNELARLKEAAR